MIETIQEFYNYNQIAVTETNKISYDEAIEIVDCFCEEYND